jgi:hypothetical protein
MNSSAPMRRSYAARKHDVALVDKTRSELARAFTELDAWPDSAAVLQKLRERGLWLAPLANFTAHDRAPPRTGAPASFG